MKLYGLCHNYYNLCTQLMKKSLADCTEMPFWSLFHRRFCQPESFSIFKSRKENLAASKTKERYF